MANGKKDKVYQRKTLCMEEAGKQPRKRRTETQATGMECCIPWSITSWRVEGPGYIAGYALYALQDNVLNTHQVQPAVASGSE